MYSYLNSYKLRNMYNKIVDMNLDIKDCINAVERELNRKKTPLNNKLIAPTRIIETKFIKDKSVDSDTWETKRNKTYHLKVKDKNDYLINLKPYILGNYLFYVFSKEKIFWWVDTDYDFCFSSEVSSDKPIKIYIVIYSVN